MCKLNVGSGVDKVEGWRHVVGEGVWSSVVAMHRSSRPGQLSVYETVAEYVPWCYIVHSLFHEVDSSVCLI